MEPRKSKALTSRSTRSISTSSQARLKNNRISDSRRRKEREDNRIATMITKSITMKRVARRMSKKIKKKVLVIKLMKSSRRRLQERPMQRLRIIKEILMIRFRTKLTTTWIPTSTLSSYKTRQMTSTLMP